MAYSTVQLCWGCLAVMGHVSLRPLSFFGIALVIVVYAIIGGVLGLGYVVYRMWRRAVLRRAVKKILLAPP